ncbi:long-chain fatty acid--CoA ligase [Martelella alba]|uniref:Long-chain fatty acid--CoA ligase n=1 Tax=Martelella alba TaxID=2590451 RepID=A0A506U7D0_9HYPH|nr:long-chain fatty acid--CoA ligase [Martelella alba]
MFSRADEGLTLPAFFDAAVRRFSTRPAIEFYGRNYTYGEIGRLIDRFSSGLAAIGVKKGTRLGLCLPNTPYSMICYFAALKAGAIVVNFNPLYTGRELLAQIRDSGAEIMVTLDLQAAYENLGHIVSESGLRHVIVCPMADALPPAKGLAFRLLKRSEKAAIPRDGVHISYDTVMRRGRGRPLPAIALSPDDIAVLQYTGGTTGVSKGAMLSHAALISNARQMITHQGSDMLREGVETIVGVLPLFHVFAMTVIMLLAIEIGALQILVPRFNRDELIALMEKRRPTLFPAVPTIYSAINAVAMTRKIDITSLRLCISGGAPLPYEVRAQFEKLTGCTLCEGYGLTECSPVVSVNPFDGSAVRDGSAGKALPGTIVEIHDPDQPDRILATGERGEVWVRGPQNMSGYWNRTAETAATLVGDAVRTGDIGYLDQDGYLFLVDRIKDLIICGGYNVYPRVIEEALYEHDSVAEAVVIGVPDPYRGESPKAFVTIRPGNAVTPETLQAFLAERLSKIERPKAIEIRDSLPKTLIGKLSKKELIEEERNAHLCRQDEADRRPAHVDA